MMHSRLYVGQVKHRRNTPVPHAFKYGMFMLYLDLDELPTLFDKYWLWSTRRPALARFRREDHLGENAAGLAEAVRGFVRQESGITLKGPIRLLTNLRYFGYGFNPVSFYYCFDKTGSKVEAIVAEVNNTPWGQQYCYILTESTNMGNTTTKRFLLEKRFHVSPFMDMNIDYDWRFRIPADELIVHMKNFQNGKELFNASLSLREQKINSLNLASALIRYPLISVKIIVAIHYQALRLWLKNVSFYPHPDKQEAPSPVRKS